MTDDHDASSVEELVEYCRTQAGLLSGYVETLGAETDELLDEIDEDIAEIRTRLADHSSGTEGPTASATTTGPNDPQKNLTELEELETELEEKQTVAEAKRARMDAFQDLAVAYIEVAEELESTIDEGRTALDRILDFERDHDAPAYFDDRQTILEAATESGESSSE
jgi:predicted  nucleic acid-binding Zn-ribbon protein